MTKQKGICEECKVEYEYDYNKQYPRKYCMVCSAKKKQEWEAMQEDVPQDPKPDQFGSPAGTEYVDPKPEVVRPGEKSETPVRDRAERIGLLPEKPKRGPVQRGAFDKDPVGLAVDIFCAMISDIKDTEGYSSSDVMARAIVLVKQAQKELS